MCPLVLVISIGSVSNEIESDDLDRDPAQDLCHGCGLELVMGFKQ